MKFVKNKQFKFNKEKKKEKIKYNKYIIINDILTYFYKLINLRNPSASIISCLDLSY